MLEPSRTHTLRKAAMRLSPVALGLFHDASKPNNFAYNLENYGVSPDIFVKSSPEDELRGLDRELLTAVQQALKMLAGGKWQNVTTDGNGRQ
jgi:hypothetical protein